MSHSMAAMNYRAAQEAYGGGDSKAGAKSADAGDHSARSAWEGSASLGYGHTTKSADLDNDDPISRLATIAKTASAGPRPRETDGDTLAELRDVFKISA